MNLEKIRKLSHMALTVFFCFYILMIWLYFPIVEHLRPGIYIGSIALIIALSATFYISNSKNIVFKDVFWEIGVPIGIAFFFCFQNINFAFSETYSDRIDVFKVKPTIGGEVWDVQLNNEKKHVKLVLYYNDVSDAKPSNIEIRKGLFGFYFGSWQKLGN
jgi:hypothetical protein